jgi:Phospholipase_D-nuclease N-terminal
MAHGILGASILAVRFVSFPCCCGSFGGILGLLALAFWIWAIIDVVTNEPPHEPNKIVWVLVVILLQALGALIYFIVRRPERIRQYGK